MCVWVLIYHQYASVLKQCSKHSLSFYRYIEIGYIIPGHGLKERKFGCIPTLICKKSMQDALHHTYDSPLSCSELINFWTLMTMISAAASACSTTLALWVGSDTSVGPSWIHFFPCTVGIPNQYGEACILWRTFRQTFLAWLQETNHWSWKTSDCWDTRVVSSSSPSAKVSMRMQLIDQLENSHRWYHQWYRVQGAVSLLKIKNL